MKKLMFFIAALVSVTMMSAHVKMDAYSASVYDEVKSLTKKAPISSRLRAISVVENDEIKMSQGFMRITDESVLDELANLGVEVSLCLQNLACVSVPVENLDAVLDLDGVTRFEFAKQVYTKNNTARSYTKVANVHSGTGLSQSYTGKGVIYGTVDCGIDFNHNAFKNSSGQSRILYAYLPSTSTKYTGAQTYTAALGVGSDGYFKENVQVPGYVYPTSAIKNITTDTQSESHGTHTLGIGAGGKYGSSTYYGMAPDADIVATGCNLSDVEIINGVAIAMTEASKRNEPCVVNLSLGGNIGPHDGSDIMSQILDLLVDEGHIICISSGNEGDANMYAFKSASDSQGIVCLGATNSAGTMQYSSVPAGLVDVWDRSGNDFTFYVVVVDKTQSKLLALASVKASELSMNSAKTIQNSTYFSGSVKLYGGVDSYANKYEVLVQVPSQITVKSNYILGIGVVGNSDVDFWTNAQGLELGNGGYSNLLVGSADGSYNNMGCGMNTIVVGAWKNQSSWKCVNGSTYSYDSYGTVNDIAPFSSYGTDPNGVSHPDIVAPGFVLISALNSYDTNYASSGSEYSYVVSNTTSGGRQQRYGAMMGTSMSCPCTAGIIALWLQADPHLTVKKIKSIFKKTAINDSYTASAPLKWGAGKIDAYAGLKEVLAQSSVEGAFLDKQTLPLVAFPNPSNGVFEVTVPDAAADATVEVYSISGAQVASVKTNGNQTTTIDVADQVSNGAYVVRVVADGTVYTTKMIVKK